MALPHSIWPLVRFGAVGVAVNAIGYVVFALGLQMSMNYLAAMLVSYVTAATVGYLVHRSQTFHSTRSHAVGAPRFVVVQIAGALLNYMLLHMFVVRFRIDPLHAQLMCIVAVAAFTYIAYSAWVFVPGFDRDSTSDRRNDA